MPYNELIKIKNALSQIDVIDQNLKMRHLRAHLTLARIIIYATNMIRNASNVGDMLFSDIMYTIT